MQSPRGVRQGRGQQRFVAKFVADAALALGSNSADLSDPSTGPDGALHGETVMWKQQPRCRAPSECYYRNPSPTRGFCQSDRPLPRLDRSAAFSTPRHSHDLSPLRNCFRGIEVNSARTRRIGLRRRKKAVSHVWLTWVEFNYTRSLFKEDLDVAIKISLEQFLASLLAGLVSAVAAGRRLQRSGAIGEEATESKSSRCESVRPNSCPTRFRTPPKWPCRPS